MIQSVVAKVGVQLSGIKCGYIELSPSAGAGKGGGLAGAMCVGANTLMRQKEHLSGQHWDLNILYLHE